MSIFGKKKYVQESEEETGCMFCIYGRSDEEGGVFCRKKDRTVEPSYSCASYEYDLLKHRPASPQKAVRFDSFGGSDDE